MRPPRTVMPAIVATLVDLEEELIVADGGDDDGCGGRRQGRRLRVV